MNGDRFLFYPVFWVQIIPDCFRVSMMAATRTLNDEIPGIHTTHKFYFYKSKYSGAISPGGRYTSYYARLIK